MHTEVMQRSFIAHDGIIACSSTYCLASAAHHRKSDLKRMPISAQIHVSPSLILDALFGPAIYLFFTHRFVHSHHQDQNIRTSPLLKSSKKSSKYLPPRFLYCQPRQPSVAHGIITGRLAVALSPRLSRKFQVGDERN